MEECAVQGGERSDSKGCKPGGYDGEQRRMRGEIGTESLFRDEWGSEKEE